MSIITFIIVLLVIVLVHEFGHFIVAKRSGIRVDEFGFGFPPKIFGKKFGETLYSINLFPIGGFVRIFGETPNEESISGPDAKRSLFNKSKWTQAAVLGAGVIFNFLLAWVLFIGIFLMGAPYSVTDNIPKGGVIEDPRLTVTYVLPDSPADRAGIKPGDKIVWVRSEENDVLSEPTDVEVQQFVSEYPYDMITIAYKRGNTQLDTIEVKPEHSERLGRPAIGITMDNVGRLRLPAHRAVLEGTKTTGVMTVAVTIGLFDFFRGIMTGGADFEAVAGPIGIVGVVGDAAQLGIVSVMILTAVISINLGLINLFPFPALDGGRLLFLGIEAVRKKSIKPQVANTVNSIGFFLLLLLMAIITYYDIVDLF
ncbi:MAG: site-2 protease family protein [Candidatus Pacebacteria bacterium]|nr:site-2 protease family protein [Candidatus Paceibacterota bacterium]